MNLYGLKVWRDKQIELTSTACKDDALISTQPRRQIIETQTDDILEQGKNRRSSTSYIKIINRQLKVISKNQS